MKKSILYMLIGVLLGLGAPLGAALIHILLGDLSLGLFWKEEWARYSFFYIYTTLGTCTAFGLFGYILGGKADDLIWKEIRLSKDVLTDPLTSLGNHRFLHETFKVEFRRHVTSRLPISCVMLDLDHFKKINDTYGHPFGDYVLKHFAAIMRKCVREGDTLSRYGGEEFLCILPNCDQDQVRIVAERIRKATERHLFTNKNHRVQLTVSLGAVTSYESSGLNYRHLIALSDRALYEAKGKGRNRLVQTSIRMAKKFPRRKAS